MTKSKSSRFYNNWVNHSGGSRSLSRRIMSALRQAHRCMGLSRRRLGLGLLGGGSNVAGSSLLLALASTTMLSSSALADDWLGTYNNNFFDGRNWLAFCTNKRVILLSKGMIFGFKQIEIPLEEIAEQWTWAQLGIHQKPCAVN